MRLRSTIIALTLLLLLGTVFAQRLAHLLPQDTVFAIGAQDLSSHADKLDAIIEEAERLGLAEALDALLGEGGEELDPASQNPADELTEEIPEELATALENVELLDLLGQEAWFAVSISSFNPMPAITIVTRTTDEAGSQIADAIRRSVEAQGGETVSEGEYDIYLYSADEEGSPFPILAASRADDVLALSTNPDVLRGVLRRLAGASEPDFTDSDAYSDTLGELGEGNSYTFLDYGRLAQALEPLGADLGFERLVGRVLGGLGTIGSAASVTRVEDDGFSSESIRIPGIGDPALAALISAEEGVSREPLSFVAPTALGVNVMQLDLPGWWNYLSDLAVSSDELGNPDLNQMVMEFTGIDLRASLFDWMGTQAATITGELGELIEPGIASENLLGETVYLLEATDEAAASEGLSMLLGTASGLVASFADPSGQGAAGIEQREVAGVQVISYSLSPGLVIAHAVVDGWALIATSDAAIDEALAAHSEGVGLQGELARLAREVPEGVSSYSITDLQQMLAQTGAQTAAQMQMFAGLAGGRIDFDALQEAGATIEEFFSFLAERTGGSVSYTVPQGAGVMRSYAMTEFNW